MKIFFIYIFKCLGSFYYVGHNDDSEKRIPEHEKGIKGSWHLSN